MSARLFSHHRNTAQNKWVRRGEAMHERGRCSARFPWRLPITCATVPMVMVSRVRYQREMMANWARRHHRQRWKDVWGDVSVLLRIPVFQAGIWTVRGDWLVKEQISADQWLVHDERGLRQTQLQLSLISVCLQSDRWPSLRSADSALLWWIPIHCHMRLIS